jgi:sporulation protein YlmC with PRC-barrel domain
VNVPVSRLLGRTVRDPDGRDVGEIEELRAEIEQHPHGNDYVVTAVEVGRHRMLDMVVSGWFVPALAKRWRERANYRRYVIPWEWLDLHDPEHPRVLRPMSELPTD